MLEKYINKNKNIIIVGGTKKGRYNVLLGAMRLIDPKQRIVSIERTRSIISDENFPTSYINAIDIKNIQIEIVKVGERTIKDYVAVCHSEDIEYLLKNVLPTAKYTIMTYSELISELEMYADIVVYLKNDDTIDTVKERNYEGRASIIDTTKPTVELTPNKTDWANKQVEDVDCNEVDKVGLIVDAIEHLLGAELLEENGWKPEMVKTLKELSKGEFMLVKNSEFSKENPIKHICKCGSTNVDVMSIVEGYKEDKKTKISVAKINYICNDCGAGQTDTHYLYNAKKEDILIDDCEVNLKQYVNKSVDMEALIHLKEILNKSIDTKIIEIEDNRKQ